MSNIIIWLIILYTSHTMNICYFKLTITIVEYIYSSLRSVIEKPPIGGKEILPLTTHQLAGFRLHPGPVSIFMLFVLYIFVIFL